MVLESRARIALADLHHEIALRAERTYEGPDPWDPSWLINYVARVPDALGEFLRLERDAHEHFWAIGRYVHLTREATVYVAPVRLISGESQCPLAYNDVEAKWLDGDPTVACLMLDFSNERAA
jgi:hypothetical protein